MLEQDVRGGFRLLVEQMMGAQGDRYACHEIVWQPTIDAITGEPRLTAEFNFVPPWFFEATTGRLRFIQHYFGTVFGNERRPSFEGFEPQRCLKEIIRKADPEQGTDLAPLKPTDPEQVAPYIEMFNEPKAQETVMRALFAVLV